VKKGKQKLIKWAGIVVFVGRRIDQLPTAEGASGRRRNLELRKG